MRLQSQRENESLEEFEICLRTERSSASTSRAADTPSQRKKRLEALRKRSATSRAPETPSESQERLESQGNITSLAWASKKPSKRKKRLEGLRRHVTAARSIETLLEHVAYKANEIVTKTHEPLKRCQNVKDVLKIFDNMRHPHELSRQRWYMNVGYKASEIVL